MVLVEQSPVFTTPKKALSSTLHFSMFNPLFPSLEIFVTYGPAVVHPDRIKTEKMDNINNLIFPLVDIKDLS